MYSILISNKRYLWKLYRVQSKVSYFVMPQIARLETMHQAFTCVQKHYDSLDKKLFSLHSQIQRRQSWGHFTSKARFGLFNVFLNPKKGFALEKSPKVSNSQCFLMLLPGEICFLDEGILISEVNNFTLNIAGAQVYQMRFTNCDFIRTVLCRCIPDVTGNRVRTIRRLILDPITGTRTSCPVTVLNLCHCIILSRLVRLTMWVVLCVKPWTVEGWVSTLVVLMWLGRRVAHWGSWYNCAVCWWCF